MTEIGSEKVSADAAQGAYTGPSDQEVVAALQRMASARAQLTQAEQNATQADPSHAEHKRVEEIEQAHADLLWAQAEQLTSTKNLRKTKAVESAVRRERTLLRRYGYNSFRDYLNVRNSVPTTDTHLSLARREYEDAHATWERIQAEIEVAEPTEIVDLTDDGTFD